MSGVLRDVQMLSAVEGDTRHVHLFSGEATHAEIEPWANRMMNRGLTVAWPDGRETWLNVSAVLGDGPGRLEWHSDGNRVRHTRTLHTRLNGEVTTRELSQVWRVF